MNELLRRLIEDGAEIVTVNRGKIKITYKDFKDKYLIEGFVNQKKEPVHTRYYKKYFYRFRKELKREFGFDILKCSQCGCTEHNGRPIIMELDHLNRVTNDARIKNLDPKCPNCHQQTLGYKNRKITIEEYFKKLIKE
jgi:hypothetical protein|tara:strand:- start:342 stop:755 length:414 start_codon:yes stop_codon:yes gene_type:complete